MQTSESYRGVSNREETHVSINSRLISLGREAINFYDTLYMYEGFRDPTVEEIAGFSAAIDESPIRVGRLKIAMKMGMRV